MAGSRHPRLWRVVLLLTVCYQVGLTGKYGKNMSRIGKARMLSPERLWEVRTNQAEKKTQNDGAVVYSTAFVLVLIILIGPCEFI